MEYKNNGVYKLFRKTYYLRFHFEQKTLDNLCLLSSQKHSLNHIIFQVTEGWANRIRIRHVVVVVHVTVRIHIPRIVITTVNTVTRLFLYQDYLKTLYNIKMILKTSLRKLNEVLFLIYNRLGADCHPGRYNNSSNL